MVASDIVVVVEDMDKLEEVTIAEDMVVLEVVLIDEEA